MQVLSFCGHTAVPLTHPTEMQMKITLIASGKATVILRYIYVYLYITTPSIMCTERECGGHVCASKVSPECSCRRQKRRANCFWINIVYPISLGNKTLHCKPNHCLSPCRILIYATCPRVLYVYTSNMGANPTIWPRRTCKGPCIDPDIKTARLLAGSP